MIRLFNLPDNKALVIDTAKNCFLQFDKVQKTFVLNSSDASLNEALVNGMLSAEGVTEAELTEVEKELLNFSDILNDVSNFGALVSSK